MISVEGLIGAGKSTFCKVLRKCGYNVCEEPVADWNVSGSTGTQHNVLNAFYQQPSKYACMFQTLVLRTRIEQAKALQGEKGFVERCIHSDHLFGTVQHRLGNMDDLEYATYLYQFQQAVRDNPTPIRGFIYIKTPVDTCLSRIAKRRRKGEKQITKAYLSLLEEAHESWLSKNLNNVLVIDGEKAFDPSTIKGMVEPFKRMLGDTTLLCHDCNMYQRQVANLVAGTQRCFRCDAWRRRRKKVR